MKRRTAIGAAVVAVIALGAGTYAFAAPGAGAAGSISTTTAPASSMNILVTGQKQGVFNKPAIPVSALSHEIMVPYDPQSGLPTGKRQHWPISVTMQWGPTTPKFLSAAVSDENLTSVLIGLLRNGTEVATIKLTNARLSDFTETGQSVQFNLTYQKIEWTWLDGGIAAEDDWAAPSA